MGKYYELVTKAMENSSSDEAWEVADEIMCDLAKRDPELYKDLIHKMEKLAYRIPESEAEKLVRNMKPYGQNWSMSQIKEFVKEHGVTKDFTEWYLVMNMTYNDYCDTAKTYGLQNDPEFFFSLAKDFIEDPDAKPFKVEKYFLD